MQPNEDVKTSFAEELKPLLDKDNVKEYTIHDLQKAHLAIGKKDIHLDSLQAVFMGTSYGERRLYIVSGQPTTPKYDTTLVGYLLYKKSDGTNVMKKLRRGEKEWEVIKEIEKKPKKE